MSALAQISPVMIGYAAGLATSVLWTFSSVFFTEATRRLGPTIVNAIRLVMAFALLGLTYRAVSGEWIPPVLDRQVLYLALSGIVGLTLGDQALFTAFRDVGPRMTLLVMTTAPLFAAFFGFIALGEVLGAIAWLGILITMAGVAWVVFERPKTETGKHPPHRARGIVLAFIASACQAAGLMLSKVGIGHGWLPESEHLDPQPATLVRMFFAMLAMGPFLIYLRQREKARLARGHILSQATGARVSGLIFIFLGAFFGPFLGVWMSLVAADRVAVGIGQTLISLPPVLLLPIAHFLYREEISARAIAGALIAVSGVAILSLAS